MNTNGSTLHSNPKKLRQSWKSAFGTYFGAHGCFCASHPWEVIFTTLTIVVCLLSARVFHESDSIGPLPYLKTEEKATTFLTVIVNSLAIIYLYNQFTSLRNAGLLSIAALFIVFASFVFGTGVINIVDSKITILNEAIPFFLLLTDISKVSTLAQHASNAKSKEEVKIRISQGMSLLAPTLTLDTLVGVLIFSIGTISGVRQLEIICCFACVSLLANYLVFMTCFPASLALLLEVRSSDTNSSSSATSFIANSEHSDLNPVVQRVKVIMSLGLIAIHLHRRFISSPATTLPVSSSTSLTSHERISDSSSTSTVADTTLLSTDQMVTIGLAIVLLLKYMFYDKSPSSSASSDANPDHNISDSGSSYSEEDCTTQQVPTSTSTQQTDSSASFSIGSEEDNSKLRRNLPLSDDSSCPRTVENCLEICNSKDGCSVLSDEEIMSLVKARHIPAYKLETAVQDPQRGVEIRRKLIMESLAYKDLVIDGLPFKDYDYHKVMGACCENVIGYTPVPVGVAGPLLMNDKEYYVPMATTEGALVASTNRGCKALSSCGVNCYVVGDGMTRGPVLKLPQAAQAHNVKEWMDKKSNLEILRNVFNSTSGYARLMSTHTIIAGRLVFIRFKAETGDAMGMNMLSKGVEKCLDYLKGLFPDIDVISLSGNYCTDKKPSALNWIEGRGKYVVCEAVVPAKILEKVLKTNVDSLIEVNTDKNLIGSAMAGSLGGFNAHAANIVTAIFIATGQDPAQVVGSSNCITILEREGPDLYISCTMPSLEVGTVGGGTILPAQSSCLKLLGVDGSFDNPGDNSKMLARIICSTVLAGEISLLSALSSGHLVKSHMTMNRSRLSLSSIESNNSSTRTNSNVARKSII